MLVPYGAVERIEQVVPVTRGAQGWQHGVSILQCGWCLRSIPATPALCQPWVDVAGAHGVFGKMQVGDLKLAQHSLP